MPGLRRSDRSGQGGRGELISTSINPVPFRGVLRQLTTRFELYCHCCPAPALAAGLIITPEIRAQSELYLPITEITAAFKKLYCTALRYPPILSSTPFHNALSWADLFVALTPRFQISANPARLLQALLDDHGLLTAFLFASFLPRRFYGAFGRYPVQQASINIWLSQRPLKTLRCLDAACGTGEDGYALLKLLRERGYSARQVQIEGWTLEPLEVWAATQRRIPHDPVRERAVREWTEPLLEPLWQGSIRFDTADLLHPPPAKAFDLIICNGLLGGPIVHEPVVMTAIVRNLARLLAPGGLLLAADHFHEGWKQQCPQHELRALFTHQGLTPVETGEGIGGLKLDQHATPGQSATECHGQDQLPRLDGTVTQIFVQHQRD